MITLTNDSPLLSSTEVKAAYAAVRAAKTAYAEVMTSAGSAERLALYSAMEAAKAAVKPAILNAAQKMGVAVAVPHGGQILDRANYGAFAWFTVHLPSGETREERLKSSGKASLTWPA